MQKTWFHWTLVCILGLSMMAICWHSLTMYVQYAWLAGHPNSTETMAHTYLALANHHLVAFAIDLFQATAAIVTALVLLFARGTAPATASSGLKGQDKKAQGTA